MRHVTVLVDVVLVEILMGRISFFCGWIVQLNVNISDIPPSTVVHRPPSTVIYPLSTVRCHLSTVHRPRLPSAVAVNVHSVIDKRWTAPGGMAGDGWSTGYGRGGGGGQLTVTVQMLR